MNTSNHLFLCVLSGLISFGGFALGTTDTNSLPDSVVVVTMESAASTTNGVTGTNQASKTRWTSYYISTNEYSEYLHKEFSYESKVDLPPALDKKVESFFTDDYRDTYTVLKLSTEDEDQIYDIIDGAYHRKELFNNYHEYMDMLTELERMGSSINVHEVDFKKITVKGYEENILTVEAIWTVHGTLHHITHNHVQKNANCVEFKIEVSPENELKIKKVFIISIDRFNLYQ